MSESALTFVHLSDIHFIRGFSGESKFDQDLKVRDAILEDAHHFREKLSHIDGVLVTGDIAFAGQTEEYKTAIAWLSSLCKELRCDPAHVWCVPGNHDVDRSVIKEFSAIPVLHRELRQAGTNLDERLRTHLENENTGPMLLAPFRAYNETIGRSFESFTKPKQPWWEDELDLSDGSKLRIRGLNSALVSGSVDDDKGNKLLLGAAQTEYGRQPGVEYLTLCHHPMDWLLDADNTKEALLAYSKIQLFGHKHVQQISQVDNTLWLTAGAVHPVRGEDKWQPRYNYLSLWVEGSASDRHLCVDVYARAWSQTERQFTKEQNSHDSEKKSYRLKLEKWTVAMPAGEQKQGHSGGEMEPPKPDQVNVTLNRKKLLYRFAALPHHTRMAIMKKFDLLEAGDESKPDAEVFSACFDRANKKNVLEDLWRAIEAESG